MTGTERLAAALLRFNLPALIALLLVLAALAAGLPRLEVTSNTRAFFGDGNQEFLDLQAIEETYTRPNTLLVALIPPEGTAFAPATLETLREMTDDAWQVPYVLRVDAPVNHMHTFAQGDDIFVEPMLDEYEDITPEAAARFAELAMASDSLRNALLSEAGDVFGLTIRVVLPDDAPEAGQEVETYLRDLSARWEAENEGWSVHMLGGLLANTLLRQVAVDDIRYLVPLSFLAAMGFLTLALGSLRSVAVTISVLAASTLATFGFAGWVGIPLTAGTAISPLAVMVLVSTSCVHITLGTVRAAESAKSAHPFAHALRENLAPVTVSHLTTAFAFACLNFAPSPPLANMGNIVAFGLIFGLVAVFIILPTFFANKPPLRTGRLMVSQQAMRRFAGWVARTSGVWLIVFPLLGVLGLYGVSRIEFNDNVIRYFDDRYELRQDAEIIQERLTGLETLQFSLRAPDGASVFDPAYLRAMDRFSDWLLVQPGVVSVSGLSNIIADINRSMSGDDPEAEVVADTQPGNAQLLMFYELSLPVGMDMTSALDVDRTQSLLVATVRSTHASELRDLADRAEAWLLDNEAAIATRATGLSIAFARISERNNSQMLIGFAVVLLIVSLTLVVTLRSVRYGVLSLIPNLLPALMAFGLWGVFMRDVNLGSTVVTTMTFGIVVDDTVHFLMHFLRCRRRKMATLPALEETFSVAGSSILLTSLALIFGFGIMAASGFAINQHIGLLTAVVILFALLSDLLFLPALLVKLQGQLK